MQPTTENNLPPPRFFFAVSLGAAGFFAIWAFFVFRFGDIAHLDEQIAEYWHQWTQEHRGPMGFMIFLTEMGGIAAMVLMTTLGVFWQSSLNQRWLAVAWVVVALGGGVVNMSTKAFFSRPRPENHAEVVHEKNYSFPSGHSMGSAVGYGFLGYTLVLPQRRRSLRIVSVLLMIAIVLGVGFSRIFLRAHWFSDVVAGWTIGICWLTFCIGWLEWSRLRLGLRPEPHQP